MAKDSTGRNAMTKVTLRPKITFVGDTQPTSKELERMHQLSHESCFIANSVATTVVTELA